MIIVAETWRTFGIHNKGERKPLHMTKNKRCQINTHWYYIVDNAFFIYSDTAQHLQNTITRILALCIRNAITTTVRAHI